MIVKCKHKKNFVKISNDTIQNESLSWGAKGLLSYLLSLPHDWNVHLTELFKRSTSGRRATESAMKELIREGYVIKEQGEDWRNETEYTVYETSRISSAE